MDYSTLSSNLSNKKIKRICALCNVVGHLATKCPTRFEEFSSDEDVQSCSSKGESEGTSVRFDKYSHKRFGEDRVIKIEDQSACDDRSDE